MANILKCHNHHRRYCQNRYGKYSQRHDDLDHRQATLTDLLLTNPKQHNFTAKTDYSGITGLKVL